MIEGARSLLGSRALLNLSTVQIKEYAEALLSQLPITRTTVSAIWVFGTSCIWVQTLAAFACRQHSSRHTPGLAAPRLSSALPLACALPYMLLALHGNNSLWQAFHRPSNGRHHRDVEQAAL